MGYIVAVDQTVNQVKGTTMFTCPVCNGEGVLFEVEEWDMSTGSNPNRVPDFQDVVVDERLCPHCDSRGQNEAPFFKCDYCHWVEPSTSMIIEADENGVLCCYCPECNSFIKEK